MKAFNKKNKPKHQKALRVALIRGFSSSKRNPESICFAMNYYTAKSISIVWGSRWCNKNYKSVVKPSDYDSFRADLLLRAIDRRVQNNLKLKRGKK